MSAKVTRFLLSALVGMFLAWFGSDVPAARADVTSDMYDDIKTVFAQVITDDITGGVIKNVYAVTPGISAYYHDSLDLMGRRQYGSVPQTLKSESVVLMKDFVYWESGRIIDNKTKPTFADIAIFFSERGTFAQVGWLGSHWHDYCASVAADANAECIKQATEAQTNLDAFQKAPTSENLAKLRCPPGTAKYAAIWDVPCLAPQHTTDIDGFAKPTSLYDSNCTEQPPKLACTLADLAEAAMLRQSDRAKQKLVRLAVYFASDVSARASGIPQVTIERKLQSLIDELLATDGRNRLGSAFDVLLEFAQGTDAPPPAAAPTAVPSAGPGPAISASPSGSTPSSTPPLELSRSEALTLARKLLHAWSDKAVGGIAVTSGGVSLPIIKLTTNDIYAALKTAALSTKLANSSNAVQDLMAQLLANGSNEFAAKLCAKKDDVVQAHLQIVLVGLPDFDFSLQASCVVAGRPPTFDGNWAIASLIVRKTLLMKNAFAELDGLVSAAETLFGIHVPPSKLADVVALVSDLAPTVNAIANDRTALTDANLDALATTLASLLSSACQGAVGAPAWCGIESFVKPNEAWLRPVVTAVFRGEFRQATLQVVKSQLAPVGEDANNTCTASRQERRFLLSFAAFVLDDSAAPGSRETVREGFRSAALDLISCFTSDGYQLMTKPGWHTLAVDKTFTPTLGMRFATSGSFGYVFGQNSAQTRFMPTLEWPNFTRRISPQGRWYMLAVQLSLIDIIAPMREFAVRPHDVNFSNDEALALDLIEPRLSLAFGVPQITNNVWLVGSAGLRMIAPDRARYGAETANAQTADMHYRTWGTPCNADYCRQHSASDFVELSVGAVFVF